MATGLGGRRQEGRRASPAADSCPSTGLGAPKKAPGALPATCSDGGTELAARVPGRGCPGARRPAWGESWPWPALGGARGDPPDTARRGGPLPRPRVPLSAWRETDPRGAVASAH